MIDYDTPTNLAFTQLKAKPPRQHWSQFDVSLDQARNGRARLLVTTIWNAHAESRRATEIELAISRNQGDGSLWYRIGQPPPGSPSTASSHWDRIQLARDQGIPIVGVLKDFRTHRCSINDVFKCSEVRDDVEGSAVWLALQPSRPLNTAVQMIEIEERTAGARFTKNEAVDADSIFRASRQSFLADAARRRAIELHAMAAATEYFRKQWPVVRNVSETAPFDLHCWRGKSELRVEVKGTTTGGNQIILTQNEVLNAQDPKNRVALFILSEIVVSADNTCTGGEALVFEPWVPSQNQLTPIAYKYVLQSAA